MIIALSVLIFFLTIATIALIRRVTRLEQSRQYRVTRIYNQEGKEVMNRWTEQLDTGHWVTITTDVINHKVLYAEHTRTDENTNFVGRENCIRADHKYNRSTVWGEYYERPLPQKRLSSKFRQRGART